MIPTRVPDRAYTDAELDAAIAELSDPARLRDAQDIVTRAAPSLQRVLVGKCCARSDKAGERARATTEEAVTQRRQR